MTTTPRASFPIAPDGYAPEGHFGVRRARWLNWTVKTGNGSMVSTARDLLRWVRAFFGGRLVGSEARAAMLTEHTAHVGYGWFVRPRHGRQQVHINGRSPGFSSYVGHYPEESLTVIVLTNIYNSITTKVGSDLAAIHLGETHKTLPLDPRPLSGEAAAGVPGRFQFGPEFYNPNVVAELEVRKGHVFVVWTRGEFESALIRCGKDRFIDRMFWSDVEFVRGSDGRVAQVRFDDFIGNRVVTSPRSTPRPASK